MPSTFAGLNIAASGLNSFQAAINVTANNIANANTKGYTRQEAIRQAAQALAVNQKFGTMGTGVETTAIRQIRDVYYDVRFWNNNARTGMYEQRLHFARQIEDYLLDDDAMKGFSTILNEMFHAMDSLKTDAGSRDTRAQFLGKVQNFATYFNGLSTDFSKIQESANQEVKNQVEQINSIAERISALNTQINRLELRGVQANELRDQRNLLLDELSGIVPIEVSEARSSNSPIGGTRFTVRINGQILVDDDRHNRLEVVARASKRNESDLEGLYDIRWSKTQDPFGAASLSGGSLRGVMDMRDGNSVGTMGIPYYMAQLNDFARAFAEKMNDLQLAGVDGNGDDGRAIFVPSDLGKLTAGNIAISPEMLKDPSLLSTAFKGSNLEDVGNDDLIIAMLRLKNQDKVNGGAADQFMHGLVTGNAMDIQRSQLFHRNHTNLSNAIEMRRMSVSGVDQDEEALNIIKFQNAYNLSSRIIQTMTQMYDRLILQTGV